VQIVEAHARLAATVYATDSSATRFVVVFGSGLTRTQARKQLAVVRRRGASGETHLARF
jgi:hypothetical protein